MKIKIYLLLITTICSLQIKAQNIVSLKGKVTDPKGNPIESAHVRNMSNNTGVISKKDGTYLLKIPRKRNVLIQASSIGYKPVSYTINSEEIDADNFNIVLEIQVSNIEEVAVYGELSPESNLVKIESKHIEINPDLSGNLESIIKTLPGVSSNTELSSQYSVRGGSYDENMIYVNDIEIYRPLLVRSGQQEGLSFLNSDMVSSIRFSAGGFEARYGDKMSSVLDIRYNKPYEFSGKVSASLLGGTAHVEDISKNGKFSYNIGMRYKTSQYVLSSLETKGDYKPNFYDVQSFFSYKLNDKIDFDFLGYYALNSYNFTPENRTTSFGTIQEALNLKIYYEGQEKDRFRSSMGAFTCNYVPGEKTSLKLILSAFQTHEQETYDILGEYYLNELDNSIGSETYGDSLMNIGIGSFLNHARNYLTLNVYSLALKGGYYLPKNKFRWGIKYNYETINDELNQWEKIDSAGYSLPDNSEKVLLYKSARADNTIRSNRITAYIQNTYNKKLINNSDLFFNIGLRAHYWDFNKELIVTPRISISYKPSLKKDLLFRFASGLYYQPAFYKEMKNHKGILNRNVKAQKSIHFVLGGDYLFKAWNRPFKLTTEIYYKKLNDLIPYKIENVHLQYSGQNISTGYAYGVDFKVNGEFVEGIESWASLSLMQTKENTDGDNMGYYSRPTNQLVNFSLFFQDYLPMNPSYRMNLSLHYGTGLPFATPQEGKYFDVFKMRAYKRVDLGFSKVIIDKDKEFKKHKWLNVFEDMWLSCEVFNLLNINNTISYMWIRTVNNQSGEAGQYAVPNYLTSRRINIKLTVKF
ncbi:MAG: TonB-dependent receptor [Bacteroidales bacterium]|nr:TonB-dependent receptor [Bacteroidales bacterium]